MKRAEQRRIEFRRIKK
jgi:hypothetical protein